MSIVGVLTVRLTGTVDETVLDLLCAELGMEPEGRLGDDWDDKFGMRWLRPEAEGVAWLELYRETDTEWDILLSAEPPFPTASEITRIREQTFATARRLRLTARQTYPSVGEKTREPSVEEHYRELEARSLRNVGSRTTLTSEVRNVLHVR